MQNDLVELYNLLTLLKPGIFKTLKEFRAAYMTAGKPRQPANPERLRELMRGAMIRNTRAVAALTLPRRHATTMRVDGPTASDAPIEDLAAAVRGLAAGGAGGIGWHLQHLLAPRDRRRRLPPPRWRVSPRVRARSRPGERLASDGRL